MPRPVSMTSIPACVPWRDSRAVTRPPRSVNLTAFDSTFHTTCWSLTPSPITRAPEPSMATSSTTPPLVAAGRTASAAALITVSRYTGLRSTVSLPAAMRERSIKSSISRARSRMLRSTVSIPRFEAVASSRPPRSIAAQPSAEFSGVRSSCDSIARKSSLARLASSAAVCAVCARSSSLNRSWAMARRSVTTAASGNVVTAIVPMKTCTRRSDVFWLPTANGPSPRTVADTAIPERITIRVAASRTPSLKAAQISGGMAMNGTGSMPRSQKTSAPTSTVTSSTPTASRRRSRANTGGWVHRTINGAMMRAPTTSPSHHVHQIRPPSVHAA